MPTPDKPLIVKCTFHRKHKRIAFQSARNCTYDLLRSKVEQCFSLRGTPYMISYDDDDRETSIIETDDELSEAIDFFNGGNDDAPQSSNSSVLSGRSTRKIYMEVEVIIEFDGRLSDTASLDDYREEGESQLSLSLNSVGREFDDDDVTVSSRDYISAPQLSMSQRISGSGWQVVSHTEPIEEGILEDLVNSSRTRPESEMESSVPKLSPDSIEDPFADVDIQENQEGDAMSLDFDPPAVNDRHAAWLREQTLLNSHTNLNNIERKFQAHDSPSQLGSESLFSLEQDTHGKYYYSYTPASSNEYHDHNGYREDPQTEELDTRPRPSSMQMAWLASQRGYPEGQTQTQTINEYEPPLPQSTTSAPPELVTECSHCGVLLETIRYVCSTCGPKSPATNGFSSSSSSFSIDHSYPPTPVRSLVHPLASSSQTLIGSSSSLAGAVRDRPLPPLPNNNGYELCSECVQSYGLYHAIEGSRDPESPPTSGTLMPSLIELQNLSILHRSAPQKGKLRHAFREQMWESNKWIDLLQDESSVRVCSMCSNETDKKRYKCAVCLKIHMCQSCYSQVHDLHPKHAFIAVPDVEVSMSFRVHPPEEEQPLLHRGVNCVHCRREIIGARFHCPFCGVDICQNCEAAGLPGNLDASNGGHDSTHIMLKIPYYMDTEKVNRISTLAARRFNSSDAAMIGTSGNPSTSHVDISASLGMNPLDQRDHQILCGHCRQTIVGIRYQCANCPSSPIGYSLCQTCEERSYVIHNAKHVFFRLPRPVDRAIEFPIPLLPIMYQEPAGPSGGSFLPKDPKAYLKSLYHKSAVCDCCFEQIRGEWFRCVYCPRDLCHDCLKVDTHDDTHIFIVFKSKVDMQIFQQHMSVDAQAIMPPVIPHPVYHSLISNL